MAIKNLCQHFSIWQGTMNNCFKPSIFRCKSAVLCSTIYGNEVIAGTFNKSLAVVSLGPVHGIWYCHLLYLRPKIWLTLLCWGLASFLASYELLRSMLFTLGRVQSKQQDKPWEKERARQLCSLLTREHNPCESCVSLRKRNTSAFVESGVCSLGELNL